MTRKQWVEIFVAAAAIATALALPALSQQAGIPEGAPISRSGGGNGTGPGAPEAVRTAFVVEGTITGVNIPFAGGGPIVSLLNGLISFDINGARIISSEGGTALSEVRTGQRIMAILKDPATQTSGMNKAESVFVLQDSAIATLRGTIDAIDVAGGTLTVLGWKISVDAKTAFGGPREGSGVKSLADLKVKDDVTVTSTPRDQALYGLRVIKMMEAPQPTESFNGTVVSIGTTSWVIKNAEGRDITVLVTAQTRIAGEPKAGDKVNVLAQRDSAGILTALAIVKVSDIPVTLRFRGVVTSITETVWKVRPFEGMEQAVQVNRDTKVSGSPKVGDWVDVEGKLASGAFVATSITKLEQTPPGGETSFEGVVKSIDPGSWMVDGVKVMVSSRTEIVGSPAVGDRVQVTGQRAAMGFMATKIVKITR